MDWFENDAFWEELAPFLFSEERLRSAENEVELALSLADGPVRRVLDLACGPGRHALALARRGLAVTAVDRTAPYLDRARRDAESEGLAIEWVREDMRRFRRPGAFDLALSLFTSFGYFEREEDDLRVLRNLRESLAPGGLLIMDLVAKEWVAGHYEETLSRELEDGTLLIERHAIIDDWERIRNEWLLVSGDRVRRFVFTHRLYSGRELRDRLVQAGFAEVRLFGDLEGNEFGLGAKRLVAVAR